MTLQGRLHITTQKFKVIYSLFELDINASQACPIHITWKGLSHQLPGSLYPSYSLNRKTPWQSSYFWIHAYSLQISTYNDKWRIVETRPGVQQCQAQGQVFCP